MSELSESNGRMPIGWTVQIVGWVVAMLVAYGMAQADIAKLQTKQENTDRRLERIEQKLDVLLERR